MERRGEERSVPRYLTAEVLSPPPDSGVPPARLAAHVVEVSELEMINNIALQS